MRGPAKASKTEISKAEYFQLVGLIYLSRAHVSLLNQVAAQIRSLTGEVDDTGHSMDIAFEGSTANPKELLQKLGLTVDAWCAERPPRIAFYEGDGKRTFGEEGVVEYRAAGYVASRRLEPGEAKEIARREWREHLGVRRNLLDLDRRLTSIEKFLSGK